MPYALTNATADQPAREFLTDRRRFPLEGATTTDLAKAMVWAERSGPFRLQQRHPHLASFRKVSIDPGTLKTARAADRAASGSEKPIKHGRKITHPAKLRQRAGKAHLRRRTPGKGSKVVRRVKRASVRRQAA